MKHCTIRTSAAALPFALTCLGILFLPELPLVDMPNHLGRAFVISRLPQDAVLDGYYRYQFVFTPYILGDLILAWMLKLMPTFAAARIWSVILFLGLPLAWIDYLRARGSSVQAGNPVFLALLFYLSLNYFYLSGYNNFCLGVLLCI